MKKNILTISICFFQLSFGANRPYNDVLKELAPTECTQVKENIYLSQKDRVAIEEMSSTKIYGGLALRYVTTCPNTKEKSYHYVDSHIVRTLNETVILTIHNDKLKSFIVSSFNEPREYIAPKKWYAQFEGAEGKKVLRAREEIDALSGATLTVNASIGSVNKTLALHRYLKSQKKVP
jgi:uncharacterized protein with FMN-binding domain